MFVPIDAAQCEADGRHYIGGQKPHHLIIYSTKFTLRPSLPPSSKTELVMYVLLLQLYTAAAAVWFCYIDSVVYLPKYITQFEPISCRHVLMKKFVPISWELK